MDRAQNINPRMLSWARETAGFSVAVTRLELENPSFAAASSIEKPAVSRAQDSILGFSDSKRVTATEKLQAFEEGHESRPAFSF